MYKALFFGNQLISIDSIDSTNSYLKKIITEDEMIMEGLVVTTNHQYSGRGQMGTKWESEKGKNLIFSIFLKPKLPVDNQFILSKVISLGILDFIKNEGVNDVKIKWPNDIYVEGKKIAGILIENNLKEKNIDNSVVGIGLNINQTEFLNTISNATSLKLLRNKDYELEDLLKQVLFFVEKRYLQLKSNKSKIIDQEYLSNLFQINQKCKYSIAGEVFLATITNINKSGKLILKMENNDLKEFDLKELTFIN